MGASNALEDGAPSWLAELDPSVIEALSKDVPNRELLV